MTARSSHASVILQAASPPPIPHHPFPPFPTLTHKAPTHPHPPTHTCSMSSMYCVSWGSPCFSQASHKCSSLSKFRRSRDSASSMPNSASPAASTSQQASSRAAFHQQAVGGSQVAAPRCRQALNRQPSRHRTAPHRTLLLVPVLSLGHGQCCQLHPAAAGVLQVDQLLQRCCRVVAERGRRCVGGRGAVKKMGLAGRTALL